MLKLSCRPVSGLRQRSTAIVTSNRTGWWRLLTTRKDREPAYFLGGITGYKVYEHQRPFTLVSGEAIHSLKIAYETWGNLNSHKDNAILLQTGMSASSHACSNAANPAPGWWEEYIGPGKALDTNLFYVICSNNLGGCYGTSGPSSVDPSTGKRYSRNFPRFSILDMVNAQFELVNHLQIQRLHACVGSSLGGMLSLCSAQNHPDRVGKFASISACAKSFPGTIAFRHAQRQAIMADPNWKNGDYYEGELPAAGLRLARQIGTITYRSGIEWKERFDQKLQGTNGRGQYQCPMANELMIEHYLAHQGDKWVNNYDPNSLLWISKAMDMFTMEKKDKHGVDSLVEGVKDAMMPALIIGVQSDVLFPVWQQKEIADSLRAAGNKHVAYYELDSIFGHDAFLLEAVAVAPAVKGHLEQEPFGAEHLWKDLARSSSQILQLVLTRNSSADNFRDIFRAIAMLEGNADDIEVETSRLLAVTKLVLQGHVPETKVEHIFSTYLRGPTVTMGGFLSVRSRLLLGEDEEFLP